MVSRIFDWLGNRPAREGLLWIGAFACLCGAMVRPAGIFIVHLIGMAMAAGTLLGIGVVLK